MSIKFAVVREDPNIELAVLRHFGGRAALLVASGGCTALALAHAHPDLALTLYDFNPDQLAHVDARARAVAAGDGDRLGIESADPESLAQCGEFERLFRVLATAIRELVVGTADLEVWFGRGTDPRSAEEARRWFASPYWPSVFHTAFNDPLLIAMFGPDAVQHAPPGSYPVYFQGVFERGLVRADGPTNPFLQHILLGRYLARDAPSFLTSRVAMRFTSVLGGLPDVPDLDRYDLVHVSNIFDWSNDEQVREWCEVLRGLHPGAVVVIRQLNNARDLGALLGAWFEVDHAFGDRLQMQDRSLFYNRIVVAVRSDRPA